MKKMRNVIVVLSVIGSTVLMSAGNVESPSGVQVKSAVEKKIIYQFYNADYGIRIDYNPGSGKVLGVTSDFGNIIDYDPNGTGITYNAASRSISVSNYKIKFAGQDWSEIGGGFYRL